MRALLLLLCLLSSQAWAASYHVCPRVDEFGIALTYGSGNGSSQANCYIGFSAAAAAGVVTAGDTVYAHGTFYDENGYAWVSGASNVSRVTYDLSDAIFWRSANVSGLYTTATTTPFGQATNGSGGWRNVSGDLWKKGVGVGPYKMWVGGIEVPFANPIPATQDDAGITAVISTGQFASTTTALDGYPKTLYYKGTLSTNMRVNIQSQTSEINSLGGFVVDGKSYVTLTSPKIRGYRTNVLELGGLFIQNCTSCIVTDPVVYEGNIGIKIQNNTDLSISGSSCYIHDNYGGGINLGGQREMSTGTSFVFISAITNVAGTTPGGKITTLAAHGLSNGEKVIIQGVSGMTGINSSSIERTVTVVDGTNFTIATDTSAMGTYTSGGQLWVQRTDSNTTVKDCLVQNNGNGPVYNSLTINWSADCDGFGIGYLGGTVSNVTIRGNKFWGNGPTRAPYAGETGTVERGSGILIGTSFTMDVTATIDGNDFLLNHRYNATIDDTSRAVISGNTFRGTRMFTTSSTKAQLRLSTSPATSTRYVIGNLFTGSSSVAALRAETSSAGITAYIFNNIFANLELNSGTDSATWSGVIDQNSTTGSVIEGSNIFYNTPANLYMRVGTPHTTVASWAAASGQGVGSAVQDPSFVGGTSPTEVKGFKLTSSSTLRRAGKDIAIGNVQDAGNRAFLHPPSIGVWESTSGDAAPTRTRRP
jgi:hypothetical protein